MNGIPKTRQPLYGDYMERVGKSNDAPKSNTKEYLEFNKEPIKDYQTKWRILNRQRTNSIATTKVRCECCNIDVSKANWNKHIKTNKHIKNAEKIKNTIIT